MTLTGTATCVQNTTRVSGGGHDRPTSTSYITMFRIDGRQCSMTTSRPVAMAEGDQIIASGRESGSGITVFAVRNATNGITSHSGIVGKIILGLIFPIFGLLFCGIASIFLGSYASVLYLGFVAYSIYLFYQAYMAASARRQVSAL
jgi:hypothetical protein